jgi:ABC-type polar amino acid transport system ATPase subunit
VALSQALKTAGKGQVIITHEAGIVRALADEVLVLDSGHGTVFETSAFFVHHPWQGLLSQELIVS